LGEGSEYSFSLSIDRCRDLSALRWADDLVVWAQGRSRARGEGRGALEAQRWEAFLGGLHRRERGLGEGGEDRGRSGGTAGASAGYTLDHMGAVEGPGSLSPLLPPPPVL
jgi:hypothetical protein